MLLTTKFPLHISVSSSSSTNSFMTAFNPPEQVQSFLLDLPKEIRLMIYETLLIHHGNLYFDPTYSLYRCDHKLYPQILATCRFLYDEAVPLLYSKNKLVVDSKRSLLKLWETIDRRSSPSSETNTLDITSLSIVGYSPLGNFLDDVQKTATKLPALRSLSIELDDVIMKYYIRHDQKSKYVERRIKLRNNLLSKFRTVTESHPLLMRIVEVCYEKDVNYRRGMHFRLLGQGVKDDEEVIDTANHAEYDRMADPMGSVVDYQDSD